MTEEDKAARSERIKGKFQKLGKIITEVGFPIAGRAASILSPQGVELIKTVGKVIGAIQGNNENLGEDEIDKIEQVIAAKSPGDHPGDATDRGATRPGSS